MTDAVKNMNRKMDKKSKQKNNEKKKGDYRFTSKHVRTTNTKLLKGAHAPLDNISQK